MSDYLKDLIIAAAIVLTAVLLGVGLIFAAQTWTIEYPACSYSNGFKDC
jgi:hypothetical protein